MTIRIRARIPLIHMEGKTVTTNFLYKREGQPLPRVGEAAVVVSDHNGAEFSGRVIEVNELRHGYIARIDLSQKER